MQVQLLLEERAPIVFEFLRPIAILPTSCKTSSLVMLHICECHDLGLHAGTQKTPTSAPIFHIPSEPSVEKATGSSVRLFVAQVDFARVYDSVLHSAVIRAMRRRGMPETVMAAYVRNMRKTELIFEHGGWRTKGVHPTVGL